LKTIYQQTEVSSYTKTIATEYKFAHFQTRPLVVGTIHSSIHGQAPSYAAKSPRKTANKYSSAQNSPERVMRRLARKRFLDKVHNAAIEKNSANSNDKKQGKQQSKRNEKEVPKHGVANNIKGKKVASKRKVGRGKNLEFSMIQLEAEENGAAFSEP
jgi:hypothetical protein